MTSLNVAFSPSSTELIVCHPASRTIFVGALLAGFKTRGVSQKFRASHETRLG
jgi:hypothetical protein